MEENLYTAVEDRIDIVNADGAYAQTLARANLIPFTLVAATTRTGLLTNPMRRASGIPRGSTTTAPRSWRASWRARGCWVCRSRTMPRRGGALGARRASPTGCCVPGA
ncbi:MAG: hypothetical protein IPL19_09045 [Sandaracinaceae bacterium]|nr:hypothetical protein [Sandaracinaceae bacterium]